MSRGIAEGLRRVRDLAAFSDLLDKRPGVERNREMKQFLNTLGKLFSELAEETDRRVAAVSLGTAVQQQGVGVAVNAGAIGSTTIFTAVFPVRLAWVDADVERYTGFPTRPSMKIDVVRADGGATVPLFPVRQLPPVAPRTGARFTMNNLIAILGPGDRLVLTVTAASSPAVSYRIITMGSVTT